MDKNTNKWSEKNTMLPLQRAWVQSLVGELRSRMPEMKKKKKALKIYSFEAHKHKELFRT